MAASTTPTSILGVAIIILVVLTPSAAPQAAVPCPDTCAGTVSIGTLIGCCIAVLVATLLVELAIYLCYRHCTKPCSKSSDSDMSSVDGLPTPKDYHAASWSYRGGLKQKDKTEKVKKSEVFNISESKTEEDKVMFSPGLYRTSLEPKSRAMKGNKDNVVVDGADNYVPEFPTIYSYNSAWDNTVDRVLSKHGRYDLDNTSMDSFVSIDLDDDNHEYPILRAPKDGVGSIDFTNAKFGLHNRGFVPDGSENGDTSTYRYFTGMNGKVQPEMIPMEELDHHHHYQKKSKEYPILKTYQDGVGSVDFRNAKFGLHNRGFVPDSISLDGSDNGDISTYRYFTGMNGKMQPEMIPMKELDFDPRYHHRRSKEYPILKTHHEGVGSVDFRNAKFGIHNRGFVPDSVSLGGSDDGDMSTYRYFTGMNRAKNRPSLISQDNTVIDMEWDDYTDPDSTRIDIDDNFMIGAPSVSTIEGSDDIPHHRYEQDFDMTGNFILRKPDTHVRSDHSSSDEDLYDYGDSDTERKTLAQKHGPWTSTFSRATYKAKMGEVALERDLPPDESRMPDFGERFRYSTGLRRAKFTAMRAAAVPTSREKDEVIRRQHEEAIIKRHQEQSLSQERPDSQAPQVMGFIKLVRPEVHERAQSPEPRQTRGRSTAPVLGQIRLSRPEVFDDAIYQDTPFRLAPAPRQDEEDDDLMVLYPIKNSKDDVICKRCRGEMNKHTKDSAAQASIEHAHAFTISETHSGRRRKKDHGVETIGVIHLMQPYDTGTVSSTSSKKQVRFKDQETRKSSSMRSMSPEYFTITIDDEGMFVRETSRSASRGSSERRKRRSKSLPVRGPRRGRPEPVPTIGVIKLMSPDASIDDAQLDTQFDALVSDQGYSSQTSVADRRLYESDTLDNMDGHHTIGILKLVSPHSSPLPVRSERLQRRARSPEKKARSPERRSRSATRRVRSPERYSSPERRVKSLDRHTTAEIHSSAERRVKSLDRHSVPDDRRQRSPRRTRSPDQRIRSPEKSHRSPDQRRTSPEKRHRRSREVSASPDRTIGYVKLVSPKLRRKAKPQTKEVATEPHVPWTKLLHKIQECVEEDVSKRAAKRAPKEVGKIKLRRPEALVNETGAQTDKTWLEVMLDVEDVIEDKYRTTRRPAKWPRSPNSTLERNSEPISNSVETATEPVVHSVGTIKLSTPVPRTNVRDNATQPDFSWRQMMSEFEDEIRGTLRRQQHQPAHAVIKLKQQPAKIMQPSVTQTKSRGSQSQLPWGQLVQNIQDEALEDYHRQSKHQQDLEEAKKEPTVVSVVKLKGAKERAKPKLDSFTQSEQVETDEQTTQPDRPWNVILKDMKRILENEYRRTINELEERLAEMPKDEPDFAKTSPNLAIFKIKGKPKKPAPQTVAAGTQSETPQMTDHDTQPDKSWSKVVKDVREILENEYRRTIRELEDRLTEPEPDSKISPTVAVFKLKETKAAPVMPLAKPTTTDCGTEPAKPWGEIMSTRRDSVENEYRQIIRSLQSELAMPQEEEPKAKSLGFFKITGKKEKVPKAPKAAKKEKATGPMFPWSTVVKNVEDSIGRKFKKQNNYQQIDEEQQKPKNLGVITLKTPTMPRKQDQKPVEEELEAKHLGVITLKSPRLNTKMRHAQTMDSSTSPAEPWPLVEELIVPQRIQPVEASPMILGAEAGVQVESKVSTSDSSIWCRPNMATAGSSTISPTLVSQFSQSTPKDEIDTGVQVESKVSMSDSSILCRPTTATAESSTISPTLISQFSQSTAKDEIDTGTQMMIDFGTEIGIQVGSKVSTSDFSILCRPSMSTTGFSTVPPAVVNQFSQSVPPDEANTGTQVRPDYADFSHQEAVPVRHANTSPVFLRKQLLTMSPVEITSREPEVVEKPKPELTRELVTRLEIEPTPVVEKVSTSDSSIMCRPSVSTTGSATMPPIVVNQFSQSVPPDEANTGTQVRPDYADFSHQETVPVRHANTSPILLRKQLLSISPIEIISKDPEEPKPEPIQELVTRQEFEPVHAPINLGVLTKDSYTQYDKVLTNDSVSQYEWDQTSVNIQVEPETRSQQIETIAKELHEMATQLDPISQKHFQTQVAPDMADIDTMTLTKIMKDSYAYSDDSPMLWKQTQTSPSMKSLGITTDPKEGLMASTQTMMDVLHRYTQYEADTLDNWVQVAAVQRHGISQTDWQVPDEQPEITPEEVRNVKAVRYSSIYDSDSGVDTRTQTEPVHIAIDSSSDTDIEVMDSISQTEPGVFFTESDYSDEEIELIDVDTQSEDFVSNPPYEPEVIRVANMQQTHAMPEETIMVVDADAQTCVDVKSIYAQTKPMNVEDRAISVLAMTNLAQTQTQEMKKDINNTYSQTIHVEQVNRSSSTDPTQKAYTFVQTDTKNVVERSSSPIELQTSRAYVQTYFKPTVDRASSPTQTHVVDRAASPIQMKLIDQGNDPILTPSKECAAQASYATQDVFSQYLADVRVGNTQTSPKITRHKMSSTDQNLMVDSSSQANLTPITVVQEHVSPITITSVQKTFSAQPPNNPPTRDSSVQHNSPEIVEPVQRVALRDARVQVEPRTSEARTQSDRVMVCTSGAQVEPMTLDALTQSDRVMVSTFGSQVEPMTSEALTQCDRVMVCTSGAQVEPMTVEALTQSDRVMVSSFGSQVEPMTSEARTQSERATAFTADSQTDFPEPEPIEEVIKIAQVSPVETPMYFAPVMFDEITQTYDEVDLLEDSCTQTDTQKEYKNIVTQTVTPIDVSVVHAEAFEIQTASIPAVDFTAQAQPLTIEQTTATDRISQSTSQVQVEMSPEKVPTHDSESQHEPHFETLSSSIQVEPVTFNQGTATQPTFRRNVAIQHNVPQQKPRHMMWQVVYEMSDIGTSTRVPLSENMTQTRVAQSTTGVQMTPNLRMSSVASTVKPAVQDQASTSKPDVMEMNVQVTPIQKNEASQYERREQMDMTSQYERLESEDTSIQVGPVVSEMASSPIMSKRNDSSMGIQTDPVDDEVMVSVIGEEMVKQAEIISVMAEPDASLATLPEYFRDQSIQVDIEDNLLMCDKWIQYEATLFDAWTQGAPILADVSTQGSPMLADVSTQGAPILVDVSTQGKPPTLTKSVKAVVTNRPKSTQANPSTYERGTATQPLYQNHRATSPLLMRKNDVAIQYEEPVELEPVIEPVLMEQVHASMTMSSSFLSAEKIQLRDEVKEEVRDEIREEVREELRDEVKETVKMEIHHDVQEMVRRELEDEVRHEMTFVIREELRRDVKEEVRTEFQSRVRFEMEDRYRDDMEFRLRGELEPKVREELRDEVKEAVKMEIHRDVQETVRRELEDEVRHEMTFVIREELRRDVKEEVRTEFQSRIRIEMEDRYRDDMEFRLRGELEPKIRSELEPVMALRLRGELTPKIRSEIEPVMEFRLRGELEPKIRSELEPIIRREIEWEIEEQKPVGVDQGTSPKQGFMFSKPTQTTIKTTSQGTQLEKPQANNALTQVQPSTYDRGTSPLETLTRVVSVQAMPPQEDKNTQFDTEPTAKIVEVKSLPSGPPSDQVSINVQTEYEQSTEAIQATVNHKASFTQYESLYCIDRTLQVQPVMVNQGTSTPPRGGRDQIDGGNFFDIDAEIQASVDTREGGNSPPPSHTSTRSTSPYDQPEADYTPPGLDKLRYRPTTLKLGTRRVFSPVNDKTPVKVEEPIKPIDCDVTNQSPDLSSLERALSPTTQNLFSRLDYSLQSRSRDPSPKTETTRQFMYTYTRYDDVPTDVKESYTSRLNRDNSITAPRRFTSTPATSNILPPGTQVIVVQPSAPGYTTAIISNTSPTVTTSLPRGGKPTEFTSLSPILSSVSDGSSQGVDELEQVRKDLRMSQVIITDDPIKLINFLLNQDVYPNRRPKGRFAKYKPMETSTSLLFNDTQESQHTSDYRHLTPTLDFRRQTTSTTTRNRSLLRISTASPDTIDSPFRLNVSHDSKGSPRPGSGLTPPRAKSPLPMRVTPEQIAKLPIPRGMTTRLADLLDGESDPHDPAASPSELPEGPPWFDPSVHELAEFFDSQEAIDNYLSPDKKDIPTQADSEVDTHDSDTESEHWQAELDFTRPSSSYQDQHYWSDDPGHLSHSSSESLSEDDNISLSCTYDLLYPSLSRTRPMSSSDDDLYSPRQSFRRRRQKPKQKAQLDSKKLRNELELTEVVKPKTRNVELIGYSPSEERRRHLSDDRWCDSLSSWNRSRSEPDIISLTGSLVHDDQSIPGSPTLTPSLATGSTTERLKEKLAAVARGVLVDTEFATVTHSPLDQVRYASLVGSGRPTSDRGPRFGRSAQLSRSEPDLASGAGYRVRRPRPSGGVHDMGSF